MMIRKQLWMTGIIIGLIMPLYGLEEIGDETEKSVNQLLCDNEQEYAVLVPPVVSTARAQQPSTEAESPHHRTALMHAVAILQDALVIDEILYPSSQTKRAYESCEDEDSAVYTKKSARKYVHAIKKTARKKHTEDCTERSIKRHNRKAYTYPCLVEKCGFVGTQSVDLAHHGLIHTIAQPPDHKALYNALVAGNQCMVEALLNHTIDLEQAVEKNGVTLLMAAAQRNNASAVKSLLQAGATINGVDERGDTALMKAARHGCFRSVQILLAAGAQKNNTNIWQETALTIASALGYKGIVMLLLK